MRDSTLLDREITPTINLVLQATDRGTPNPRASILQIQVVLDDINDNTPVFRQSVYDASVTEVHTVNIIYQPNINLPVNSLAGFRYWCVCHCSGGY